MLTRGKPWLFVLGFAAAAALGWLMGAAPAARRASVAAGGDRWNDRVVLTGPISRDRDRDGSFHSVDALYVLNYSNGLLLAALPSFEATAAGRKTFTDFAERDLVRDFGIQPGVNAHFLMTTLACGTKTEGWAPLIVIETETGQVATYRVQAHSVAGTNQPTFLLVERRSDPRLARALAQDAAAR